MQFQSYDLGTIDKGNIVEVTLGYAANVRIMDSSNFYSFKSGRRHRFIGGYVKQSPFKVTIPNTAHWYAVIDLGGYSGKIKSAVRVLPGLLPSANQRSLSSVPSLLLSGNDSESNADQVRDFDVFISHASEDKDEVARPLASIL